MNHIYRLVWNETTRTWAAVAETAKGRGKRSGGTTGSARAGRTLRTIAAKTIAVSLAFIGAQAWALDPTALPTGGQVVAGSAAISQAANALNVQQASQRAILNWQSFNIGAAASVNFSQPNASAVALNRILGNEASQIYGKLNANGQVFFINPNGMLFARGAQVNVGGLMATTLNIGNADFMSGNYRFSNPGNGTIRNEGLINAVGSVVLVGNSVQNAGQVFATTATLAAGNTVALDLTGDGLIRARVEDAAIKAKIENSGEIGAASVTLSAGQSRDAINSVVNNTGLIRATGFGTVNGEIVLEGGLVKNAGTLSAVNADGSGGRVLLQGADVELSAGSVVSASGSAGGGNIQVMGDMTAGSVKVAGTLDASAPGTGNGGFIETSAAHVDVANDSKVTTASAMGLAGTWLIDPFDFTIAASGGNMTGTSLAASLVAGNVTIQSTNGSTGTAGDVNVNDVVGWFANKLTLNAQNNININANLNGSGAASLALEYGQQAVAAGNTSDYKLAPGVQVNLPAGPNFSTKLGSNGAVKNYTVITGLGVPGSTTATDLQGMGGVAGAGLASNYALGGDIDASSTNGWNSGAGFAPVGDATTAFTGTFTGLGHTVSGVTIYLPTTNKVGLFGAADTGAVIRDIGLVGGSVTGATYTGSLLGYNTAGVVSNSYATGRVSGNNNVGGLLGINDGGTINSSFATGSVSGNNYVGGLAGINSNGGTISNSLATGSVSGNNYVGGLVGANYGSISASYATGSVRGSTRVGGLVGTNYGTILDSYATGSAYGSSNSSQVGGLVGLNGAGGTITSSFSTGGVDGGEGGDIGGLVGNNAGDITNSYWNTDVASTGVGAGVGTGATGLTTADMRVKSLLQTGLDFDSGTPAWKITDGTTRPYLAWQGTWSATVSDAATLNLVQVAPQETYTQTADIDMKGKPFSSIGSAGIPFTGSFDGQNHTISNLQIDTPGSDGVGMFGVVEGSGASIANVGLVGGSTRGLRNVGALVGRNIGGTIDNNWSTGSVTSVGTAYQDGYVGGLVGRNESGGVISNSFATGNVSGNDYVGGLAGFSTGPLSNSYATGSVSGNSLVGGLVGKNGAGGSIANAYATGDVSASDLALGYVGGLVGMNYSGASIDNAYSTGVASGGYGPRAGGFVGVSTYGSTINNSYWNSGKNGGLSDIGSQSSISPTTLFGLSTADMRTASSFAGIFNFVTTPSGATASDWVLVNADGTLQTNASSTEGATYPMLASEYSTTIRNAHQLQLVTMDLGASYTLANKIDASATGSGTDVWAGSGFVPIGIHSSPQFSGTFDGQGHTISGLTINMPGGAYVGLFGETAIGSSISNVGLVGGSTIGNVYVGSLVASNNGTVSNSYATGDVNGNQYVGGLISFNGGTVTNSHAAGNVTAVNQTAGGLVSYNNGSITGSHATGSVSAADYAGGLVGFNGSSIGGSYATGVVTASNESAGGLVGKSAGSITGSHATGNVSGYGKVGGLVGWNVAGGTGIDNSYATGIVSGTVPDGGTGFGGLVGNNDGSINNSYASGAVSGYGNVGGLVGKNTAAITGSHATGAVAGGDYGDVGGLVGWNNGGSIDTSYATGNVTGTGSYWVGGLVGYDNGTISNSFATGVVSGYGSVGGLVGYGSGSTISNSYASGSVSGSYYVGGLVGYGNGAMITQSYSSGSVSGSNYVGGLVGYGYGATITQSYSSGSVSGTTNVGGLLGFNFGGETTVTDSFWNTTTSGQGLSAGGAGLTSAEMTKMSSFTNWSIANAGGSSATWRIYEGQTAPLLRNFLTPLTLGDAPDASATYNGATQGGNTTANGGVLGSAASGRNVGTYAGYYSTQQGYDITGGNLTISQLASVAWVGGTTGNWSTAANWAGGATPDLANVASVTIAPGNTVTYDSGVTGPTSLTTLNSSGSNLVMAAGALSTSGNFSTAGYQQTGGVLSVGGDMVVTNSFAKASGSTGSLVLTGAGSTLSINQAAGDLTFYNDQALRLGPVASAGNLLIDTSSGTITTTGLITAPGNITLQATDLVVSQNIEKSGTGNQTATLGASNDIQIGSGVTIGNASGASGTLDVVLNADTDASGAGAISVISASILSNGGNIKLGGGASANGYATSAIGGGAAGVALFGATLTAGNGDITIRGQGATAASGQNFGVYISGNSTLSTGTGAISITGQGGNGAGFNENLGVFLAGGASTVNINALSAGGSITITGTGGAGDMFNDGVQFQQGVSITAAAGDIVIDGTRGSGATGQANAGVSFKGGGGNTSRVIEVFGNGNITITGGGTAAGATDNNNGVSLGSSTVRIDGTGLLSITGTGGGAGNSNRGVSVAGSILRSTGGALTIDNTSVGSSIASLSIDSTAVEAGSTLTLQSNANVDLNVGTTLTAPTISATGTNVSLYDGTLNVGGVGTAGTMDVTGNLFLGASSILNIDIGGATAGTQFDQVTVSGNATLGGTLNLAETGGFKTKFSDTLTLIAGGAAPGGSFGTVNSVTTGSSATLGTAVSGNNLGAKLVSGTTNYTAAGASNWNTAANWDRGTPNAVADAVIAVAGTNTITVNTSQSAKSLDVSSTNTVLVSGAVTLNITDSVTNAGTIRLQSAGSTTTTMTAGVGFDNTGLVEILNNPGSGGGTGPSVLNVTSGTFVNAIGATLRSGGSGTTPADNVLNAQLLNQGTVDVVRGLSISNAGRTFDSSGASTLSIASGQKLTVNGGITSLGSGTSFSGSGTLVVAGPTLDLASNMTLPGSGGVVLDLNGTGAVTVSSGTPGTDLILPATGSLTLSSDTIASSVDLVNSGTVLVSGSGLSSAINGGLSNAATTGTIRVQSAGSATTTLTVDQGFANDGLIELLNNPGSGGGTGPSVLNVTNGTFTNATGATFRSGGTGTTPTDNVLNALVLNQGTVDVVRGLSISNAGRTFDSSGTSTLSIAGGQKLTVNGGTTSLGSGTGFSGSGTLVIAGPTLDLASNLTLPGSGGVVLDLNGTGAVTVSSGTPGTDLILSATGALTLSSDTIAASVDLLNSGTVLVSGSGLSSVINGGLSNAATTGTLRVQSAGSATTTLTVDQGFANDGLIELLNNPGSGGGTGPSVLNVTNGTFTNAAGATFRSGGTGTTPVNNALGATAVNQGTLDIQRGLTVTSLAANDGTITFSTNNPTLTLGNAALTNNAAGVIQGVGTLNVGAGTLSNGGVIRPGGAGAAGTLGVTGNLTNAGSIEIELGGTTAGTQYDVLAVSGALTRGGTVAFSEINGFVTDGGQTFTPFTHASATGTFALTNPADVTLAPTYGATTTSFLSSVVTRFTGATSNAWEIGTNWTRGTPTANKDAVVNVTGQTKTATVSTGTQVAKSLTLGDDETVSITGGTLQLDGTSTAAAGTTLSLSGGTLTGAGGLTVAGQFNWSGSSVISGSGTLTTLGATALAPSFNQTTALRGSRIWDNYGTVSFTPNAGTLSFFQIDDAVGDGVAVFNNQAGGVFNLNAPVSDNHIIGFGTFNNAGQFNKNLSGSAVTSAFLPTFNNLLGGVVNVTSGTLRFDAGGADAGNYVLSNNATLQFNGGPRTITGDIGGAGNVIFSKPQTATAVYTMSGDYNISGSTAANLDDLGAAGDLIFNGTVTNLGASYSQSGGITNVSFAGITGGAATGFQNLTSVSVNGGSLTLAGGTDLTGVTTLTRAGSGTLDLADNNLSLSNLNVTGGILTGTGSISVSGGFNWGGSLTSYITGSGTLTTLAGSTSTLTPGFARTISLRGSRTWDNFGTATLTPDAGTISYFEIDDTLTGGVAVLNNQLGGVFNLNPSYNDNHIVGVGTINNAGTLNKNLNGTASSSGINPVLNNLAGGVVNVNSGALNQNGAFTQSGSINVASGSTFRKTGGFTNAAGGVLAGGGTIDVGAGNTLANSGIIRPGGVGVAGTLGVAGSLSSTGAIEIDLGGTTAGTQYDVLAVNGNVALGGTLNASLIGGYVPVNGDALSFVTMTGTASGSFAGSPPSSLPADMFAGYNLAAGEAARLIYFFSPSGTKTFVNVTGNLDWATAANWSGGTLPGVADEALISTGFAVTHASGTDNIAALTVNSGNALDVSGGSLTVGGATNAAGSITVSGGTLALNGTSSVSTLGLSSGALNGSGDLTVSNAFNYSGGTVGLSGALDVTHSGNLALPAMGSLTSLLARATGNISLTGSIAASGSGNAITLAAGGDFLNSGNYTLSPGSGRWLVYSQDPASIVKGGLSAGFKRYNCTFGAGCLTAGTTIPGTGDGFVYSIAPVITVTPDGQTVTYGNAGYTSTLSGFVDGDTVADTPGTIALSIGGATSTSGNPIVGTHELTYTGGLSSSLGYQFQDAASTNELTVDPRALTVTATGVNKEYNATLAAAATLADDRISGDLLTVGSGAIGFLDKNVGTGKTVNVNGITLGGTDSGNYTFNTTAVTSADITAAPLTLSTSNVTKSYDGGFSAAGTATVTGGTLFSGDTLSGGTFSFTDRNVGSGNKMVSVSGIGVNDGNGGNNYSVSFADNTTSTITQLGSVAWTSGSPGNWSNPANWAGGALPDGGNVAAVSIPPGANVTYDATTGATQLTSLTSQGNLSVTGGALTLGNAPADVSQVQGATLNLSAGKLTVNGSLQASVLRVTGGTLDGTGNLASPDFAQTGGTFSPGLSNLILASVGNFNLTSPLGATQSITLSSSGAILDGLSPGPLASVSAPSVQLTAAAGIGSAAAPLRLLTAALQATTATGTIQLHNTPVGGVILSGLVTGDASDVTYDQDGQTLNVIGPVTSQGGAILIDPPTDVALNGAIATTGSGSVTIEASNNLVMAPSATVSSGSGGVSMLAGGNISLASINAGGGNAVIQSSTASIGTATPGVNNVTAPDITLNAQTGIEMGYIASALHVSNTSGLILLTDFGTGLSITNQAPPVTSTETATLNQIVTTVIQQSLAPVQTTTTNEIKQTGDSGTTVVDDKTKENEAEKPADKPTTQTVTVGGNTVQKPAEETVNTGRVKGQTLVCRAK